MARDLTFVEHLEELRRRIIISLAWLTVTALVSFPFASSILKILKYPAAGMITTFAYFSPPEAFLVYMHIALVSGFVISLPVIAYQVWAFIAPAIDESLRRHAATFISACTVSFIAGCLFGYFLLLPAALRFLLHIGTGDFTPVISASKYIGFAIALIVGCGVVFQMPVVSFILTRIGIVNAHWLRTHTKYAVVGIAIASAVITPTPDMFNMMLLAAPMLVLYGVSIFVSWCARRHPY